MAEGEVNEMEWRWRMKWTVKGLIGGCLTQSSGGDGASVIIGDRTVPRHTKNPSLRVSKNWYG